MARSWRERKIDPVPPEAVERIRVEFLRRDDRASALVVCLIAYGGLRTLSEILELELRDIGTKVMRVNARYDPARRVSAAQQIERARAALAEPDA